MVTSTPTCSSEENGHVTAHSHWASRSVSLKVTLPSYWDMDPSCGGSGRTSATPFDSQIRDMQPSQSNLFRTTLPNTRREHATKVDGSICKRPHAPQRYGLAQKSKASCNGACTGILHNRSVFSISVAGAASTLPPFVSSAVSRRDGPLFWRRSDE